MTAAGFQSQQRAGIVVTAGQPAGVSMQLQLAASTQTVEVSAASASVQTENADVSTNFDTQLVQDLPNPGAGITYYPQRAPAVVMNTQSGYGNFVVVGMPAISNLFHD